MTEPSAVDNPEQAEPIGGTVRLPGIEIGAPADLVVFPETHGRT